MRSWRQPEVVDMAEDFHCNDLCFLKQKHPKDSSIRDQAHESDCDCGVEEELG
jgi:hypothetical protein